MKQGVTNMQNILIVVDMQNDFIDGGHEGGTCHCSEGGGEDPEF